MTTPVDPSSVYSGATDGDDVADDVAQDDTGVLELTDAERAELEEHVRMGQWVGGAAGLAFGLYRRSLATGAVLAVLGYFGGGMAAGFLGGANIAGERHA